MNLIFTISLRNLVRQKRRNIFLGTAIALGTMILILANSFSHGISDVLFNKIMVYVSGHVSVGFSENGNIVKQIFHDGDRAMEIARREVPGVIAIQEAIGVFSRAIGNGRSDNVIMVGMDLKQSGDEKLRKEAEENFKMIDGQFEDLTSGVFTNPVLLADQKAKYLNVKRGDVLRVRYQTVTGQSQAARLTVAGIFKPANMFMQAPIFLEVTNLKSLLGYGPHDIGLLHITMKEPKKFAIQAAEKLHEAFKPDIAAIGAEVSSPPSSQKVPATVLGLKTDTSAASVTKQLLSVDSIDSSVKEGVFASASLSRQLNLKPGDTCTVTYITKYEKSEITLRLVVTGLIADSVSLPGDILLVNDKAFFKAYYAAWPENAREKPGYYVPSDSSAVAAALSREWVLFERAKTTTEFSKLQREIGRKKLRGTAVDVRTMYESASAVLNLERALNLITFLAVMVLFFIILIGVVNTLRMTVRERTREIGTMRAIGMQRVDVRNSFVLETVFLTLFASAAGTALAFVAMWALSLLTIDPQDNPMGMLLVSGHLNFVPTVGAILFYNALIIAIAALTAYFPARRAAALSAAAALRHFE